MIREKWGRADIGHLTFALKIVPGSKSEDQLPVMGCFLYTFVLVINLTVKRVEMEKRSNKLCLANAPMLSHEIGKFPEIKLIN